MQCMCEGLSTFFLPVRVLAELPPGVATTDAAVRTGQDTYIIARSSSARGGTVLPASAGQGKTNNLHTLYLLCIVGNCER
eukprot:COSAG06_NODE_35655_length_457_cov_0.916201_2_plen_79_part_01